MNFPPDPIRQRMLYRTEWKSIGVSGDFPEHQADDMNDAFVRLHAEGFQVSQILPATSGQKPGFLVIGQKASPIGVENPTPMGTPLVGTGAQQEVEVLYTFTKLGTTYDEKFPTLQAAVRRAVADLNSEGIQPLSIHVTSLTTYRTGDLLALSERLR